MKKLLTFFLMSGFTVATSLAEMNSVYIEGVKWEYSVSKEWSDEENSYILNVVLLSTTLENSWFVNIPTLSDLGIQISSWGEWDDSINDYRSHFTYEGDDVIPRYRISDALFKYDISYYWSNSSGGYVYGYDVTDVGCEAFMNYGVIEYLHCERLETIEMSAFEGCHNLAHPEEFCKNLKNIGDRAFYGCASLTNFTIGAFLTNISETAFLNCQNLESFSIHPSNKWFRCENDCVIRNSDNTLIAVAGKKKSVQIPEGVVSIGSYVFSENTNLVSIVMPSTLTDIKEYAFYGCIGLKSVILNEGLVYIGYQSFYGCKEIVEIEFPQSLVNIASHAFENCERIRSLNFPSSLKNLGGYSFRGCKRLVSYNIPNGLSVHDGTFEGCGVFVVDVISNSMRKDDPTIMDIVYRVSYRTNELVSVRVLAFQDGVRSLNNVIRPETFVDGTEENVGDGITVNEDHKISWKVSADWAETLSKLNVEVMAERKNRYTWRYMIIPGLENGKKLKVYTQSIGPLQTYDALLWLYASKDPDITIDNGNLYGGGELLASGKYLRVVKQGSEAGNVDYKNHDSSPARFVLPKLGFRLLTSDEVSRFSSLTRISTSEKIVDTTDWRPCSYGDGYEWTHLYMPHVFCGEYVED